MQIGGASDVKRSTKIATSSLYGEQLAKKTVRNDVRAIKRPQLFTEVYLQQLDNTSQMGRSSLNPRIPQFYTENNVGKYAFGIAHLMDRSNQSTCIPQCTIGDPQTMCKSSMWNNTYYSLPVCYAESRDLSAEKPSAPSERNAIVIENSSLCTLLDSTTVRSGEFSEWGPDVTGQGREEWQTEQGKTACAINSEGLWVT